MAGIKLRPIVIPRSWDAQSMKFAVVFNFEFAGNDDDEFRTSAELQQWPRTLTSLKWLTQSELVQAMAQDPTLTLGQASAKDRPYLEVKLQTNADDAHPDYGPEMCRHVFRSPMPDQSKALTAWQGIFKDLMTRTGPTTSRRGESGLVKIFKGGGNVRGVGSRTDVSVNPNGARARCSIFPSIGRRCNPPTDTTSPSRERPQFVRDGNFHKR